jgi:hypothetical protein
MDRQPAKTTETARKKRILVVQRGEITGIICWKLKTTKGIWKTLYLNGENEFHRVLFIDAQNQYQSLGRCVNINMSVSTTNDI